MEKICITGKPFSLYLYKKDFLKNWAYIILTTRLIMRKDNGWQKCIVYNISSFLLFFFFRLIWYLCKNFSYGVFFYNFFWGLFFLRIKIRLFCFVFLKWKTISFSSFVMILLQIKRNSIKNRVVIIIEIIKNILNLLFFL